MLSCISNCSLMEWGKRNSKTEGCHILYINAKYPEPSCTKGYLGETGCRMIGKQST